jgi:glucan 1,3-beta-glucosidase
MPSSYKPNYSVFRNVVTDFGADNTGNTDASVAIQKAIDGT